MKIIGEQIQGTHQRGPQAIEVRGVTLICELAVKQAEAGAAWLDVNAGTGSLLSQFQ